MRVFGFAPDRRPALRAAGGWRGRRDARATLAAAQLVELFQDGIEADGVARLNGLEHRDFQQDFLGRGVAQAEFGIGQHFENSREGCGVGQRGLFLERRDFGFGNFEQIQIAARDLENEQVAEMVQQVGEQAPEVLAVLREFVQFG